MPYIGNNIPAGSYRKLTDISSGFNGVTTTFQLSVPPGTSSYYVTPASIYQLIISVGGIIQNPGVDYTLSGSQIVFTTAPAAGLSFFGVQMGDAVDVGKPSAGSVTQSTLGTITSLALTGATSGTSTIQPPAVAGNQTFTLDTTGGTLDRLNRAGNVLQVVNATWSANTTNSTSTYADTGLTATITPTSSSNKILVLVNQVGCYKSTSDTSMQLRLFRGATAILDFESAAGGTGSTATNAVGAASTCYLDSPATTSAVTYKTQFRSTGNNALVIVQFFLGGITPYSTITLMEIAA